jgi:RNA polymerase sigma-70 factor (ECF subfamily)
MTVMADGPPADLSAQVRRPGLEDDSLVERFAAGDASTFDRIVAGQQVRITRLVHRLLGWEEDVQDVVQEVFLAALKSRKAFRGGSSLSTWLTRIAINQCRTQARRRFLWRRLTRALADRRRSQPAAADRQAIDRETLQQVRQAVQALPAACREVAVLRYLEEMSIEEIAEVLAVSRNVVEVRLHRARQKLRAWLDGLIEETRP